MITGNLGIIGSAIIVHSRVMDLQAMTILSQGSIRTNLGKEDKLLKRLPDLVQKLYAK